MVNGSFIYPCWTGTACCNLTDVLSVFFCFLPWLDLWVVNSGVVSWYLDYWWQGFSLYGLKIGDYCTSGSSFSIQDKVASISVPDFLRIGQRIFWQSLSGFCPVAQGFLSEVFWNLRLCHMSFLLSLVLLSQFPARWASCHFPCTGFSLRSASTWELLLSWASAVLGFCLMGAELRLFQPGYIQEMHHRCQGSVQFPRFRLVTAKIWSDGHGPVLHLSVTPQCYSSVLFGKQRKIHPLGVRAGQPKRREEKRDVSILFF